MIVTAATGCKCTQYGMLLPAVCSEDGELAVEQGLVEVMVTLSGAAILERGLTREGKAEH